jgi:defect-in-organelle-trafficking protein DotC
MKNWLKFRIFGIATMAVMATPAFAAKPQQISADVGYVQTNNLPVGSNVVSPIRMQAIHEAATTLGAQGALAWRSVQIDNSLNNQGSYLDQVFNFNQLILPHNVLPPVLVEADNDLNLASTTSIRLASKIYKIQQAAQFVTAPPTWRTYLWMDYPKPSMPDRTLLPTTQAEAQVWNHYFQSGWKKGVFQANEIFSENLARLKRDYMGMVLYRKLLAQRMVTAPYVAQADLGVTGDANEIRVNDQVVRITAPSQLQINAAKWKPVLTSK